MIEGAAMGAGGYGAGNRLGVDAAQVGDGEAELGQLSTQVVQADAGFKGDGACVTVGGQDVVEVVEIHHPRRGTSEVGRGMGVSDDDESSATSSGERDGLLDLRKGLRLDVDFGPRIVRLSPCVMEMVCGVSKGNVVVELGKLLSEFGLHRWLHGLLSHHPTRCCDQCRYSATLYRIIDEKMDKKKLALL